MTRKRKDVKQASNVFPESAEQQVEMRRPNRRQETRLELPVGKPDLEALRSVTREWLVPLLVEKFLREQGIELRARSKTDPGKTTPMNEKKKYGSP